MPTSSIIKLLVVDDDPEDIDLIRIYLRKISNQAYQVDGVWDFDAAVEAIGRDRHDAYFVDYRLRAGNGIDLIRKVIKNGCQKPIIVLTGRGNPDVDIEAMEAGAVDYLVKDGLTPEQLEHSIRYSILQAQVQDALREANDALERRVSERTEELRRSEAGLLKILDNSPFGVSIVSRTSRDRLYVNRRFTEMFGTGSDETAIEQDVAESYVNPADLEDNWAAFERDGVINAIEQQRKRPDGTVWWCLANWRPFAFMDEETVMVWHSDITERIQAEGALRESETRFKDIAEIASDIISEMDSELRFTFVSDRYFEITGKKRADIIGKTRFEIASPKELRQNPEKWQRHREDLENQRPFRNLDNVVMSSSGEELHFAVSGKPVFDDEGVFLGYRATARDITERVEAGRRVQQSEDRLRNVFETSPVGIAITTLETNKRLYINPAMVKLFGAKSADHFLESDLRTSFANPADLDWLRSKTGKDFITEAEIERVRLDGTKWWGLINRRLINYEDQECILVWHFDITERKRADQALRESEERFRTVIDNLPSFVTLKDTDGRWQLVNRKHADMFGNEPQDVVGKISFDILPEKQGTEAHAHERKVLETKSASTEERQIFIKQEAHDFLITKFPVLDGAGDVVRIGTIGTDITERKQAEEALKENTELVGLLRKTAADANRATNYEEALKTCLGTICEFAGWPAGHVYIRSTENDGMMASTDIWHLDDPNRFALWRAVSGNSETKMGDGFISRVFATRHPLWIENIPETTSIHRVHRAKGDIEVKSGFALPVLSQNNVVAVLEFFTDEIVEQNDELLESLIHIGAQLGRVFERKQAEEELNQATKLVNLLRRTADDANKATSFEEAMHTCLATIGGHTGWPVGHVYLLSDDDDVLVPSGIWHLEDPKHFAAFVSATKKTTFKRGIGLPGRVLESGEPAWIVDVAKDPNFPRANLANDIGVHGAFAFPVRVDEQVVAVLEFFDEQVDEPDESLLATVVHIGGQLSRVFERKQAETELRKAMDEIDMANRSLEKKVQARTHELHEAKDEAEAARHEAETASQTKTAFLANMSHELRTPLNAIIGFSEMIKGAMFGPLESKYQEYAKDIGVSGEHLLGVLADILDVSKVEAGALDIEEEEIDLAKTAGACEMMVGGRAEEAGVTLTFDVAADLPPLYADPLRLKQILLNLIGNAIKFTPEGGRITVTGETHGDGGVALVVSDTGVGIAKDDIPKVLEKFGQVRDGHMQAHVGAGLGLALSKTLMELHGGRLEIESEVGKGTIVTVTFPPERTKKPPGRQATKG